MINDQWDVARVPFPFTDRAAVKKRPALVLSTRRFNAAAGHTIMAMITKRDQSVWPQDTKAFGRRITMSWTGRRPVSNFPAGSG